MKINVNTKIEVSKVDDFFANFGKEKGEAV